MIDNPNGARATRGLLLQITAGIFVIHNVIYNKSTGKQRKSYNPIGVLVLKKALMLFYFFD